MSKRAKIAKRLRDRRAAFTGESPGDKTHQTDVHRPGSKSGLKAS